MKRYGLLIGSVGGAVAIHVALVACGGMSLGVGGQDGGIVADAGQWLADAARDVVGLETGDAVAQDAGGTRSAPIAADCDQVAIGVRSAAFGGDTNAAWYADVVVNGLDPRAAPHVSVVLCDPVTPQRPNQPCTAGPAVCTSSGYIPPAWDCVTRDAVVLPGRVVVLCGISIGVTRDADGGVRVADDSHYQHAYIRID